MWRSRRGQLLSELIVWGLSFLIFIFAAPLFVEAVGLSTSSGPVAFVVRGTPFVLLILFIGRFIRLLGGGTSV